MAFAAAQLVKEHWRCSKVYIDESWVNVRNSGELLLVGGLFCPPGNNIESKLEELRNKIECIDTLQSSSLSGEKQVKLAEQYVKTFKESSAKFRVIILPKLKAKFAQYCNNENWRMIVKAIKLVLLHCYLSNDKDIRLIRPKLIIEKDEDYQVNFESLQKEIVSSLSISDRFYDEQIFRVRPTPIVILSEKRSFESLQLVDLLLSVVKWDIVNPVGDKMTFWVECKKILDLAQPRNATTWSTAEKINVWKFNGCENIFNF
jgi:RNase P subunit RPR2